MIKEVNLPLVISLLLSDSSLLQQPLISTGQTKLVPKPWFRLPIAEMVRKTNIQSGFNPNCVL